MMSLTRSPHPLSAGVDHMRFSNPVIRSLIVAQKHTAGTPASDADALRYISEFRRDLKAAVLAKEQAGCRRLNEAECREVIMLALGLANANTLDAVNRNKLAFATDTFLAQMERVEDTIKMQKLENQNKRLQDAQAAREVEKRQEKRSQAQRAEGPAGEAPRTSLAHTLNNKMGYDPEMAFMSAIVEVSLLFSLELLIHFAVAYRKNRPEDFSDMIKVLSETGSQIGNRLQAIITGGNEPMQTNQENPAAINAAYMQPARPRP